MQNLIHLDADGAGRCEQPLACMRTAVWGMLYADDAGTVSKSAKKAVNMMAGSGTVFET